jgi:hypothetical protein
MASLDLDVEPAPKMGLHAFGDARIGVRRQTGIGMQEYKDVSFGCACPCIHLRCAAAWRADHAVALSARQVGGTIVAAAVGDDHLVAASAQRRQRLERGADAGRLVQRRQDDAQPRIQAWNRSTLRSSPCGACAFFQAPAAYLFASAKVG